MNLLRNIFRPVGYVLIAILFSAAVALVAGFFNVTFGPGAGVAAIAVIVWVMGIWLFWED